MTSLTTHFIVADIETDGPVPGVTGMLNLSAVATVNDARVKFDCLLPRKSTSALRSLGMAGAIREVSVLGAAAGGGGGLSVPLSLSGAAASGFGLKLFNDAQALTSVPSTEKCSSDNSGVRSLCAEIAARDLRQNSVAGIRYGSESENGRVSSASAPRQNG